MDAQVQENIKSVLESQHAYYEAFWKLLHLLAFQYPMTPSDKHREIAKDTFTMVSNYLTCDDCKEHWDKQLEKIDLTNKETLMLWLFNVHNDINKSKNKPIKDETEFWLESYQNQDEEWLDQTYGVTLHGMNPKEVFDVSLKRFRIVTGYKM